MVVSASLLLFSSPGIQYAIYSLPSSATAWTSASARGAAAAAAAATAPAHGGVVELLVASSQSTVEIQNGEEAAPSPPRQQSGNQLGLYSHVHTSSISMMIAFLGWIGRRRRGTRHSSLESNP